MAALVLHTYWRSSCSYRVRIALGAKALQYASLPVNILEGVHLEGPHRARNPMGYVPCLQIDSDVFVESVAIVELLDELFPAPPLYPKDPKDRARVRALVEIVNSGTQPLQNMSVLRHHSQDAAVQREWSRHFIRKGLIAFEGMMAMNAARGVTGPFAYGSVFTAADAFLVPQMYNARRFELDVADFPNAAKAADHALALPFVAAAAPEVQPDAPQGDR